MPQKEVFKLYIFMLFSAEKLLISILFPDPEFKLAIEGVLLSIVAILGLIGNSLAIAVLSRPSIRSPINLILIGNIKNSFQNSLYLQTI